MVELAYDPARHAPLSEADWSPDAARAAIQAIVGDAEARFDPERYWPAHPMEDGAPDGSTGLYFGAVGVLWAMAFLQREGAARHGLDIPSILPKLLEASRAEWAVVGVPAGMEPTRCSYLFGEAPILLMMIGEPGVADELHRRVEGNLALPSMELMWGLAGTMLVCAFAYERTGEARWRELFLAQARRLLAELEETDLGPLWDIDLYGRRRRLLGPVHGYAGNIQALLRGWNWLSDSEQARIRSAVLATLAANACRSEAGVNWRPVVTQEPSRFLVQYCHGAPGMVTACADPAIAAPELTSLLEEGGRLTWAAGPLAKGSNLCHGTGGNGYAFLKLHQLTGDDLWLDRARAFAMTGIAQWRAANEEYGLGRYSLWTGDVGLAVYLHECLRRSARFPTIDVF